MKASRTTFLLAIVGLAPTWMIACERLRQKAPWALAFFLGGPWLLLVASFRARLAPGGATACRLAAALLAVDVVADAVHPYADRFVHWPWEIARVVVVLVAITRPAPRIAAVARACAYAVAAAHAVGMTIFAAVGASDETSEPADAALVLGFALDAQGRPQASLVARVDRAAELVNGGRARFVVASGGARRAGHSEAGVMHDLLRARGVPDERIVLDEASRTTIENFVCSGPLLETRRAKTAFLVTEPWHMKRASFLAGRYAPRIAFRRAPASSPAWRAPGSAFHWLFAEVNGWAQEVVWPNQGTTASCP